MIEHKNTRKTLNKSKSIELILVFGNVTDIACIMSIHTHTHTATHTHIYNIIYNNLDLYSALSMLMNYSDVSKFLSDLEASTSKS